MLQITIPAIEFWDELKQEFVSRKAQTLQLEHSLVSLSKWERKWHKPFLGKAEKTNEETIDYIKCMTITQNVDPDVYKYLTRENVQQIHDYINDPMTATTFSEDKSKKKNSPVITSEVIYGWMIALNVPIEFQKWHLNSLLTQIRVCEINNSPPKKKSKREILNNYAALNEMRRKKLNSRG